MKAIVCMNDLGGIGYKNDWPWRSKAEMSFFREVTVGNGNNAVVMGRKTYDSLRKKPLPKRRNYVFTRDASKSQKYDEDCIMESSLANILLLESADIFEDVFIIGGASLYELFAPFIDTIYVSHIHNTNECDVFFPIDLELYKKKELFNLTDENGQYISIAKYSLYDDGK